MRDLDPLLTRIDAVLDQPELPPLKPAPSTWLVSTTPDSPLLGARVGPAYVDEAWPEYHRDLNALWHAEHGRDLAPVAERPRPRPPRPFPVAESTALARRARAGLDARAEQLARDLTPRPPLWRRWFRRA